MIANPELWTNATFLCWREEMIEVDAVLNEFYLRHEATLNTQMVTTVSVRRKV